MIIALPPLVTLETAKVHLRITDDLHDADVQQKLTAAQDVIIDFLNSAPGDVDETWTESTVPPLVVAAILLYLTHLYQHRGDDMAPDAALWDAIRRLLARRRTQAIAGVAASA